MHTLPTRGEEAVLKEEEGANGYSSRLGVVGEGVVAWRPIAPTVCKLDASELDVLLSASPGLVGVDGDPSVDLTSFRLEIEPPNILLVFRRKPLVF